MKIDINGTGLNWILFSVGALLAVGAFAAAQPQPVLVFIGGLGAAVLLAALIRVMANDDF